MQPEINYYNAIIIIIDSVTNDPMVLKVNFSIPSFIMTEGFTAFWLTAKLFESLFDLSFQLFVFLLGIG